MVRVSIQDYAGRALVCQENQDRLAQFQTLKGALLFLNDVRPWWLSLLNDGVNSSPDSVSLFCNQVFWLLTETWQ